MVLAAIVHFFKTVFGGILKAVAWLLVMLSLWVPLLYSLIFLVVCACLGTSLGSVKTIYFIGLAVSLVIAFFVSNYQYERAKRNKKGKKADVSAALPKEEKRDEMPIKKASAETEQPAPQDNSEPQDNNPSGYEQPQNYQQGGYNQPSNYQQGGYNQPPNYNPSGYEQPQSYQQGGYNQPPSYNPSGYNQNGYNQPQNYNSSGYNQPQNYGQMPPKPDKYGFLPYNTPVPQEEPPRENESVAVFDGNNLYAREQSRPVVNEKPKVFGTRSDPTIRIYEYSDRLEYYKRTRVGMEYMYTKYKKTAL